MPISVCLLLIRIDIETVFIRLTKSRYIFKSFNCTLTIFLLSITNGSLKIYFSVLIKCIVLQVKAFWTFIWISLNNKTVDWLHMLWLLKNSNYRIVFVKIRIFCATCESTCVFILTFWIRHVFRFRTTVIKLYYFCLRFFDVPISQGSAGILENSHFSE